MNQETNFYYLSMIVNLIRFLVKYFKQINACYHVEWRYNSENDPGLNDNYFPGYNILWKAPTCHETELQRRSFIAPCRRSAVGGLQDTAGVYVRREA